MVLRNHEGYPDPTASAALCNIEQEERVGRFGYMPLVYICMSQDTPVCTTDNARRYSEFALSQDALPIAPCLLFPRAESEQARELNFHMSLILLAHCREVWYFGDIVDEGMRIMLLRAARRDMIVRHFTSDCREEESFDLRSSEQELQL